MSLLHTPKCGYPSGTHFCLLVSHCKIKTYNWRRGESNPRPVSISSEAASTYNASPGGIHQNHNKTGAKSKPMDVELARLVDAWPTLPDPIRAGIKAMVESVTATQPAPATKGSERSKPKRG